MAVLSVALSQVTASPAAASVFTSVTVGAAGNDEMVVAWQYQPFGSLQAAAGSPSAAFSVTQLTSPGSATDPPSLSVNEAGDAVLAWEDIHQHTGMGDDGRDLLGIELATRQAGGSFNAPVLVDASYRESAAKYDPAPLTATGPGGSRIAAWPTGIGSQRLVWIDQSGRLARYGPYTWPLFAYSVGIDASGTATIAGGLGPSDAAATVTADGHTATKQQLDPASKLGHRAQAVVAADGSALAYWVVPAAAGPSALMAAWRPAGSAVFTAPEKLADGCQPTAAHTLTGGGAIVGCSRTPAPGAAATVFTLITLDAAGSVVDVRDLQDPYPGAWAWVDAKLSARGDLILLSARGDEVVLLVIAPGETQPRTTPIAGQAPGLLRDPAAFDVAGDGTVFVAWGEATGVAEGNILAVQVSPTGEIAAGPTVVGSSTPAGPGTLSPAFGGIVLSSDRSTYRVGRSGRVKIAMRCVAAAGHGCRRGLQILALDRFPLSVQSIFHAFAGERQIVTFRLSRAGMGAVKTRLPLRVALPGVVRRTASGDESIAIRLRAPKAWDRRKVSG